MGPDPKILDDIARVAGGAVNILSGLQQQIREEIKTRIEEMADRLDLVPRDDLDRAMTMIAALEKRVSELEKLHAGKPAAKAKTAPKKTAAKKAAPKKKAASAKSKKK